MICIFLGLILTRATLLEILAGQDEIRKELQKIKLSLEADRAEKQRIVISESPSSTSQNGLLMAISRRRAAEDAADVGTRHRSSEMARLEYSAEATWYWCMVHRWDRVQNLVNNK